MQHLKKWKLPWLMVVLLPLLLAARPAADSGAAGQESNPQKSAALPSQSQGADASQYAGTDTCKTCHEEQFKSYDRGPHWKTEKDAHRGVAYQGCESCHGPSKDHAESADPEKAGSFKKLSAQESSKRCLKCHELGEEHSNFQRTAHLENQVGCTDCHSVHKPQVERKLLKDSQPTLCYSCHLEQKPDFSKPFHHRVNEGLVQCTDCHNQHGGFQSRQLRATATQDAVCFKCHTEKAGPFVYEHAAVKTEGCVACHTPHGSTNPRLLRRSQVNLLCLECHTLTVDSAIPAAPTFHNQARSYQACTMCHTAIHGSNSSSIFFK